MKFRLRVRLKPSSDRGEFELDRARSKNNIAENSFALGPETDNSEAFLSANLQSKSENIFLLIVHAFSQLITFSL